MIEIKFDKNNNKSIAYDVDTKVGECEFIERRLVESIIENAKQYNKKLIAECSYAKKVIEDFLIWTISWIRIWQIFYKKT